MNWLELCYRNLYSLVWRHNHNKNKYALEFSNKNNVRSIRTFRKIGSFVLVIIIKQETMTFIVNLRFIILYHLTFDPEAGTYRKWRAKILGWRECWFADCKKSWTRQNWPLSSTEAVSKLHKQHYKILCYNICICSSLYQCENHAVGCSK